MNRKTNYKTADMNPLNLKTNRVMSSTTGFLECVKTEPKKVIKTFGGMYIPMPSPEQDHISFTSPIFIATKNYINVKMMKTLTVPLDTCHSTEYCLH